MLEFYREVIVGCVSQIGYHSAHANRKGKRAEFHHWDVPSVRSQFAKSAGKRGTINILRKIVRTNTQLNKHAYHIDT
jgi:hypothetical protein